LGFLALSLDRGLRGFHGWRYLACILRCPIFLGENQAYDPSFRKKTRGVEVSRRSRRQSASALARDLIDRDLQWGFDFDRVRQLAGSIAISQWHCEKDPWRKTYPPAQLATEPQELTKKTKVCAAGDVDQTRGVP
jgi:hypothetical protein